MYRYAQNRADLVDGIRTLVLDQLRRTAHDVRALILAHPHVVPLLVTRPLSAPLGPAALSSRLGPEMAVLQVLHARITRQIDHDDLTDPDGPHPATTDRLQELVAELDTRDDA